VHLLWTHEIAHEFHAQGDLEKSQGLKISALCDRDNTFLPKAQIGFIDFVVRPIFAPLSAFCKNTAWMHRLNDNYKHWEALSDPDGFKLRQAAKDAALRRCAPPMRAHDDNLPLALQRRRRAGNEKAVDD